MGGKIVGRKEAKNSVPCTHYCPQTEMEVKVPKSQKPLTTSSSPLAGLASLTHPLTAVTQ